MMTQFKIFDNDGEWVVNNCVMPMSDGQRQLRFDPQTPCKVKVEGWVKRQLEAGVLVEAADPLAPAVQENAAEKAKPAKAAK